MPEDDASEKKPQRPKNGGKSAEKAAPPSASASAAESATTPSETGASKAPAASDQASPPKSAPRPEPVSPATEKPVVLGPTPATTEYVVTVDNRTGLPLKVERVEEGGKRAELSSAEYARLGMQPAGTQSSASTASVVDAYYRGIADYFKAITGSW